MRSNSALETIEAVESVVSHRWLDADREPTPDLGTEAKRRSDRRCRNHDEYRTGRRGVCARRSTGGGGRGSNWLVSGG